jgi:hypothetical protein
MLLTLCLNVCRLVAEPRRDLGAQASPSLMRSPDPRGGRSRLLMMQERQPRHWLPVKGWRLRRRLQIRGWQPRRAVMRLEQQVLWGT